MKICTHCQKEKPVSEFYKSPHAKDGLFSYCKSCHRIRAKEWSANNREREKETQRKWSINNRDKLRRSYKKYRDRVGKEFLATKRKAWNERERKKVIDCLLAKQKSFCAICRQDFKGRKIHIDHDHNTGEIRGLLCTWCNIGLSFIENRRGFSQMATKYLADFPAKGEKLRKYWNGNINVPIKTN